MKRAFKILTIAVGVLTLLLCCYIMAHGLGLVPELDFGAGAYYYADIPDFERYTVPAEQAFAEGGSAPADDVPAVAGSSSAALPLWVYILLFLGWGYLMWRLWLWIDRR